MFPEEVFQKKITCTKSQYVFYLSVSKEKALMLFEEENDFGILSF